MKPKPKSEAPQRKARPHVPTQICRMPRFFLKKINRTVWSLTSWQLLAPHRSIPKIGRACLERLAIALARGMAVFLSMRRMIHTLSSSATAITGLCNGIQGVLFTLACLFSSKIAPAFAYFLLFLQTQLDSSTPISCSLLCVTR